MLAAKGWLTMIKLDYKKEFKDLYVPKNIPSIVDVPPIPFFMVDGQGDPNGDAYQEAIAMLLTHSYAIRMKGKQLPGYFEYVIPPLEGLWWGLGNHINHAQRDQWQWTAMIRQPDFVTEDILQWAIQVIKPKKPSLSMDKVRLETYSEALCVQAMHIGSYSDEPAMIKKMHTFIESNGYRIAIDDQRKHHEIYLSDPNKTKLANMKTVIRLPIVKVEVSE